MRASCTSRPPSNTNGRQPALLYAHRDPHAEFLFQILGERRKAIDHAAGVLSGHNRDHDLRVLGLPILSASKARNAQCGDARKGKDRTSIDQESAPLDSFDGICRHVSDYRHTPCTATGQRLRKGDTLVTAVIQAAVAPRLSVENAEMWS